MFIPKSEIVQAPDDRRKPPPANRVSALVAASLPRSPHLHLLEGNDSATTGAHILVADGSRLYHIGASYVPALRAALESTGDSEVGAFLEHAGLLGTPYITDEPVQSPPLRSLSLAIAQKCNLGCTYCYAQEGDFGAKPRNMPLEVAQQSVTRLVDSLAPGERGHIAFMGGEPLVNRAALCATTEYARRCAAAKGVSIGFAITTNGTLLTPADGEFFERHGFAVTISLDGIGAAHDRQRAFKNGGGGSYERIIERVQPLLAMQRRMQVSARVTVTLENLCLLQTLDALIAMNFHSVGFSPLLSSPTGRGEMDIGALTEMLDQMVACGEAFERHMVAGERYPFLNMMSALRELHRGTHRPYPCGAGASYLGVSATGSLYACHRFVNDAHANMGDISTGIDAEAQNRWLADRHVHRQEPCRRCWARYLCGGGCHHEVIRRGRPACDYIRGWLHYCLQAYLRLLEQRPDFFAAEPHSV